MNTSYQMKDYRHRAKMQAVTKQVRPVFLILLLLVLLGSCAMKLLALHAKQDTDPDFQWAVYRYTAEGNPECAPWTGRVLIPTLTDEGGMLWVRLPQSPLRDITAGVCPVSAPVAM